MIVSRNSEVPEQVISNIEGKPMGGIMILRALMTGDSMTLLEVRFGAGAVSPLHIHSHESLIYVVKGKLRVTVGDESHILGPGDACRNPAGVSHAVEALDESTFVEVKSPAPKLDSFLA